MSKTMMWKQSSCKMCVILLSYVFTHNYRDVTKGLQNLGLWSAHTAFEK